MKSTVVFVANGFTRDNLRLQPWRYVYELARHKCKNSNVIVITEGDSDQKEVLLNDGLKIIETHFLSIKKQPSLVKLIKYLKPDELWWSTTQRSIAFYPVLSQIDCKKIAFITCPIYKWIELIRATFSGVPYVQTKALWSQRLIPRVFFRWLLNSKIFSHVIVQSINNYSILSQVGVFESKLHILPVGIDVEDVSPVSQEVLAKISNNINKKENEVVFLYLGALRPIRGFNSLIKAFPFVVSKKSSARLVVLARGATDEQCRKIEQDLKAREISDNVQLVPGWLSREEVWSYIELSSVVVLPFVLVPSDIPIAALEALARGKPIVVSTVDGLPELAIDRGVAIDPLDTMAFADKLIQLAVNKSLIDQYAQAASEYIETYPRWSDVGRLMDEILSGNKAGLVSE